MVTLVNKDSLYDLFGVENFNSLEGAIDSMAPSLIEYHLSNFVDFGDDTYFNKREIENSVSIGLYNIYIDYSENIYLEISENCLDETTESFW